MKRILSIVLSVVLLVAAFPLTASVSAEEEYTEAELKEMFGSVATMEISGTADYKKAREVFSLVNQVRKSAGKSSVKLDGKLTAAAMQRAAESAVLFNHLRPDVTAFSTVMKGDSLIGECLIANTSSATEMMEACVATDEYLAVLLDGYGEKARSVGVGAFKAGSTYYWVILFSSADRTANLEYSSAFPNTRYKIKFRAGVVGLEANKTKVELKESDTFTIKITNLNQLFPLEKITMPADGFQYTSSDTAVATVNSKGRITAKKGGSATITVKGGNGLALLEIAVSVSTDSLNAYMSTTDAGTPKIVWNKVTGATTYKVYRQVYKDGAWSKSSLYKSTKDLYAVDGHIKPGAKANYVVYAYKGEDLITQQSLSTLYLTKPKVNAYNVSNGVKVSWGEVVGASYYTVYRRTYSKSSGWSDPKLYKTTKELTYTDTKAKDGQKVQYHVYAHKGDYKSAYGRKIHTFTAPPKVTVANSAKGIKISWKATKAAKYTVTRSVYKDGKWGSYTSWGSMIGIKGLTYTDTKVTSGQKVRYYVEGYKDECFSQTSTVKTMMYLDQPNVKLTKATQGVKATWKKVGGATYYKVYKSVYKNGKWTEYTEYKETKSTSFADKSVKKGAKVRYTVYAVNGKYKSAYKTGVSITR